MSLIAELKRRNVFKVSAAYLALAWVMVQLTGTAAPAFGMPSFTLKLVMWIGMLGFPFVVMFAWIYELTPEGLKRENEVDRTQSITQHTGRKLDYLIVGLLVAAIAMAVLDRFAPRGATPEGNSRAEARPTEDGAANASTAVIPDVGRASARQDTSQVTAAPDDKSIAVLPFVNMSSDEEQEYFSDGIAEELLNLLAKVPELRVIARTSSFAFKGEKLEIEDIAKKLHVAHILEGSVRKSGNKVRITAQLVRTSDSTHLWSETYDRSLDDIFAVQDEIAGAVVTQLRITLLGAAPTNVQINPQAYALALQAQHLANQRTPEGNAKALEYYKKALALEPRYPRALVGLAMVYYNQASGGQRNAEEAFRLAHEAADQALAIDPNFAPAHIRLGIAMVAEEGDIGASASYFRRAMELAPTDPELLLAAADFLGRLGRFEQAIAVAERVTKADPVNAYAHYRLGILNLFAHQWDGALAALQTTVTLSPGFSGAQHMIGLALLGKGDAEGALAAMAAETTDTEYRDKGTVMALYTLGRKTEFEQAFVEFRSRWGARWPSEIAQVYAWCGDADQAFALLDKAIAQKEEGLTQQILWPAYEPVRNDPRWQAFRERLGISEAQLAAISFDVKLPN